MNQLQKLVSNIFRIKQYKPGVSYRIENGVIVSDPDNKQGYLENGYLINDIIYSITGLITNKIRVANWGLYKVNDESSLKELNAIRRKRDFLKDDFSKAIKLQKKALKPISDPKLSPLLEQPNEYCTFNDLVADSSLFKMLTGDRYIWAERLEGGANQGKPTALWILPSHLMTIVANKMLISGNTSPVIKEVGYKIFSWGINNLKVEDVIHDKYFNPDYTQTGGHLYGLAPLKSALRLTSRSNSANKAATAAFVNGGPKVVIYMDDQRFDSKQGLEQMGQIKQILASEYAGEDNFNKIAMSGYRVGVAPVGLSPVELAIIESEKWDLRRFCNVFFGVPSQLLNDPENKTYNNQKEGESALTSRCALPLMNDFRNQFNKKLRAWGYDNENIYVDYDMTCYTELQDDNKAKWEWVRELPVTNRYKLDMMGLDYEEGALGLDEIFIPTGTQLLEDLLMAEVDEVLNGNGQGNRVNGQAKVPDA